VQKFIASLMLDALSNYDITGIQLDDHFLFPNGYDKTDALTTEQKYRVCNTDQPLNFIFNIFPTPSEYNNSSVL